MNVDVTTYTQNSSKQKTWKKMFKPEESLIKDKITVDLQFIFIYKLAIILSNDFLLSSYISYSRQSYFSAISRHRMPQTNRYNRKRMYIRKFINKTLYIYLIYDTDTQL